MPSDHVDVLPVIKAWLDENHHKITKFWVGADWRGWARFEIYMVLEQALEGDCLVTHSNDDFWEDYSSGEMIDVLVEPRDNSLGSVAIRLLCERVNENEGSFENFVRQYEIGWKKLQDIGKAQSDFEGSKVLLLGFSGEAVGDGIEEFNIEPKPTTFNSGYVNCWVKEYNVPT